MEEIYGPGASAGVRRAEKQSTARSGAPDGRTTMKRRIPALLATSALALTALTATAPANAQVAAKGNDSLAGVLTSDGNTFDKNADDFDILTEAALAVIAAKPDSPVALLADGRRGSPSSPRPTEAFRLLAKDLDRQDGSRARRRSSTRWWSSPGSTRSSRSCSTTWCPAPPSTAARSSRPTAPGWTTADGEQGARSRSSMTEHGGSRSPSRTGPELREPAGDPRRPRHQQGQQADRPRDRPRAAPDRPVTRARS